jgi:hypothetical protein
VHGIRLLNNFAGRYFSHRSTVRTVFESSILGICLGNHAVSKNIIKDAGGGAARIEMIHGKFALIDSEDIPLVAEYRWNAQRGGNTSYARTTGTNRSTILMHRILLSPPPGLEVDHLNGNGLDNRRCNIHLVTRRENHQNLHIAKISRFTGISRVKKSGYWQASIFVNGKRIRLGVRKNEEDAAKLYTDACATIASGGVPIKIPDFPTTHEAFPNLKIGVLRISGLRLSRKTVGLFLVKLKRNECGCLEWTGYVSRDGRGQILITKQGVKTSLIPHRVAYAAAHGFDPSGMDIARTCGNKLCCAPEHLEPRGSYSNPVPKGEAHHRALLNDQIVRAIRVSKESQAALADRFGVHQSTISNVQHGLTWKHVAA